MSSTTPEAPLPGTLEKYTHDLTALARQGQFTPLQGHEKEIARVFQVLARLRKNNPMLLSEDSAERFATVAEVARRISSGDMPKEVKVKRMVALDFEVLLAAAQTADDYKKFLQAVLAELAFSEGQTLLVLDNIQVLLSGNWARETFNPAIVILAALARGEVTILGTMTREDYRVYMERNAARWRRCQEILVRAASG
jgi:ATP-dependent Clp protease ATP-binding subunit ClpA